MLNLDVIGEIKEILYKSDKSWKFIMEQGSRKLLATITSKNMEITDHIEVGEVYRVRGSLNAYIRKTDKGTFIDNVFYVSDLEKINNLISKGGELSEVCR